MPYKEPPEEHQFTSKNQPKHNGRPKGSKSFSTRIKELLSGISEDKEWTSPIAAELVKIIFAKDKKGEYLNITNERLKAIHDILNRLEGKAKENIELTGKDGEAIENHIVVEFVNDKNSVSGKD